MMDDASSPPGDAVAQRLPRWVRELSADELRFIERLVLNSGSLKALAAEYGVSYPTLRNRLDGLIDRLRQVEDNPADGPLKARIRQMVRDGALSVDAARQILSAHEEERETWEK